MKKKFNMKIGNNAIEILQKRYLVGEETPDEMCDRVSDKVSSAEETEELKKFWCEKFKRVLMESLFSPNSPTWRNAGANQGSFSACFYLDIEDSRESIFTILKQAVEIQAFGGGTGHNFSKLRPEGSLIKTTMGKSSGPIGFMKVFDFVVGEVIQQGGVRHGAQMALLNIDHPDIEKFITCKQTEGQLSNFNISVVISDEFMQDKLLSRYPFLYWDLQFNGDHYKTINGQELWNKIVEGAWKNGEPGVLFIDTINRLSSTFPYQVMNGCNPCAEQVLGNLESCNLGSINLSNFIFDDCSDGFEFPNPSIDWKQLRETIRIAVRFLDNVIDVNNYPIPEIEKETKKFRKIGLGVMGWADMLIKLKIVYGSQESLELAEKVMKFINEEAVRYSEELAKEKGFGTWDGFLDPAIYAHDRTNPLFKRRNATLTTIAPTGTLSLIAGCSAGIEPVFSFEFKKKCLDGEMIVIHPLLLGWLSNHDATIEDTPDYFIESKDIPPEQHVKMQAAWQKYTDNAVSKTVNLPNNATIKDVDKIYRLAYELNCKGITVYRQGSREYEAQTAVVKEPIKPKELPPEKVEQARAAIGRLAKNYRKNSDPDIETPEWLPGWREKIKTGDGTLWVHVFTDPSTGFREVWTAVSKPGRTLAAAADSTGRLITLALKKGASWDEIVKQLQGHIGEKTAWNNGVQVLSIQDGTAQVLRRRCIEKNIPMVECPFEYSCHKDELEIVEAIEDKSRIIYQSQEEINTLHGFGERVAEEFVNTDLCPDCGSALLHDEGCKGGRCGTCGFSHCS